MSQFVRIIVALCVSLPGGAFAVAPPTHAIHFNQLGGVKAWRAGGDNIVFVQDRTGQWYRAVLIESCMTLDTSTGVRFVTEVDPETNEKKSKVLVARHICTVESLTKSDPPSAK